VEGPTRFDEAFLRKLEALSVIVKRARGGDLRAERRSRRVGAGIEFADHREYAAGDDVRSLDWSLFARLDRPFVRLREEDEDVTLSVVVDTSASMAAGTPPKLELAVQIAAALGYVGLTSLDRIAVSLVGAEVREVLPPLRGRAAAPRVLSFLTNVTAAGRTDLAAALAKMGPGLGSGGGGSGSGAARRGLTILISDMLDPAGCLPVLNCLRTSRQEAVIVHLVADEDAAVPFDGDVWLEDAETGQMRALTVTPAVRRAHAERHRVLLRGVADLCRGRGLACLQIAADVPFEDAVLRILRTGGVLG
jgi:uncharacterized protein (DUF58 family)